MKYYLLDTLVDDNVTADKKWYREFKKKWIPECNHHDHDLPVNLVVEDIGLSFPLSYDSITMRLVIRDDLLEVLQTFLPETICLGKIQDTEGKLFKDRHVIDGYPAIMIRGNHHSTRQFCKVCGRFLYFPVGQPYLMRSQIPKAAVFMGSCELIVREEAGRLHRKSLWE